MLLFYTSWEVYTKFGTVSRRAEEERRREEEERRRAEEARQQRLSALADEEVRLQNELSSLRGLFTGKRRREIEQRLEDIRTEKMNLTKR